MKKYISFLRGINVSGKNLIKMSDLRALYENIGFKNVQSYIQSGNMIFETNMPAGKITGSVEKRISDNYGYDIKVILRTEKELKRIYNSNPFIKEGIDISKLYVSFFSDTPDIELKKSLENNFQGIEKFLFFEDNLFIYYPKGYGCSKTTNNFFEKRLGVKATSRNWKTTEAVKSLML